MAKLQNSNASPAEMSAADGFMRLSDALHRLTKGMWGGVSRPEPLRKINPADLRGGSVVFALDKKAAEKLRIVLKKSKELPWQINQARKLRVEPMRRNSGSVSFGPWKEYAAKLLTAAVKIGKLPAYIMPVSHTVRVQYGSEPVHLSAAILARMITRRDGLPDQPIQPTLKMAGGDEMIFKLLHDGLLLVRVTEFNDWYYSELSKGTWPSQNSRSKPKKGRPLKQTDQIISIVMSLVREQKRSVAELYRCLVELGHPNVPSPDTIARLLDRLYCETGQEEFRRIKRLRRKSV